MEGGGVEKNLIIIANFFIKKNLTTSLITYDKKFIKSFRKKVEFKTPFFNSTKKNKYFKYFLCLILLTKEIFTNDAVVFSFQANIYAIIVCKIFNTKIIVRSNSSPSGWNKNPIKNFIFKYFLKKSNEIIVNSYLFKKELDKKFNTNAKVILNPLNKSEILKKSKKKVNISFFKKNSLNIINIARFTDQKDHLTLLKAINRIKSKIDIKLLIIGYGPNKKLIKEFINKKNLNDKVCLLNYKKNPYPYLKKSQLFILSSKYEGLPNVLLEAMVLKKFIISTNCPTGPKEILQNGKFGELIKIGDSKSLSKKILNFSNKKKFYQKKALLGYNNLKTYDYSKNCHKYFSIINKYLTA